MLHQAGHQQDLLRCRTRSGPKRTGLLQQVKRPLPFLPSAGEAAGSLDIALAPACHLPDQRIDLFQWGLRLIERRIQSGG